MAELPMTCRPRRSRFRASAAPFAALSAGTDQAALPQFDVSPCANHPTTHRDRSQCGDRLCFVQMLPSPANCDLEQGLRSCRAMIYAVIVHQLAERAKPA